MNASFSARSILAAALVCAAAATVAYLIAGFMMA